jgi:hypothetical protein
MSLIKSEDDLVIIDDDLITGNSEYGPNIASFTDKYDPLDDIASFSQYAILKNDNTNIWAFGKEYVNYYVEREGVDTNNIPSLMEPALKKYISKYASVNSYLSYDNISIEKSFLYLKNIITGLESEMIGVACPGTILHLTIIASTYRTIREAKAFHRLDEKKDY